MFDCVMPTRNARNGQLFTFEGKMNIRNAKYQNDFSPIDDTGFSSMSKLYSRAYLHHLFKTNEILGLRIATQHNLRFYLHLMELMRKKISDGSFSSWSQHFLQKYEVGNC
ncbi:MAG: tRNA-guanine transglycosylase, partial [Fidelibacterota bacterium]